MPGQQSAGCKIPCRFALHFLLGIPTAEELDRDIGMTKHESLPLVIPRSPTLGWSTSRDLPISKS